MASPTRRRPEHGLPGQMNQDIAQNIQNGYGAAVAGGAEAKPSVSAELEAVVRFMEDVLVEVDDATFAKCAAKKAAASSGCVCSNASRSDFVESGNARVNVCSSSTMAVSRSMSSGSSASAPTKNS